MITSATTSSEIVERTPKVQMEIESDPGVLAKAHAQDQRFAKNLAWLHAHQAEVYSQHRGRCICVAGEELFVADDSVSAVALGEAAHPEDDGQLVRYIPKHKGPRIYANRRILVALR